MDGYGFVGMRAAGALGGVGVNGQLVYLSEEHGVAEFDADDLGEEAPALVRGVVVAGVEHAAVAWHRQRTAGAGRISGARVDSALLSPTVCRRARNRYGGRGMGGSSA